MDKQGIYYPRFWMCLEQTNCKSLLLTTFYTNIIYYLQGHTYNVYIYHTHPSNPYLSSSNIFVSASSMFPSPVGTFHTNHSCHFLLLWDLMLAQDSSHDHHNCTLAQGHSSISLSLNNLLPWGRDNLDLVCFKFEQCSCHLSWVSNTAHCCHAQQIQGHLKIKIANYIRCM